MADPGTQTTSLPAPKRQSRKSSVNTAVMIAGVIELVSTVASELLNPDQVTAAINKAKKQPAVKAMLAAAKAKTGPKGPAACCSAYHVFLQDFLGHIKAAGNEVTLMQAAGIWRVLPPEAKTDLKGRYSAIMQSYNEQVAAGTAVSLPAVTQTYLHDNHLEPVDHLQLWSQFKEAAAQATLDKAATAAAATTSEDGRGQLHTAAEKAAAAEATAAAVAPTVATNKRNDQDQQLVHQQQSKKQKTEKAHESSKRKSRREKKAKKDRHKSKSSKRDNRHNASVPTEATTGPSI